MSKNRRLSATQLHYNTFRRESKYKNLHFFKATPLFSAKPQPPSWAFLAQGAESAARPAATKEMMGMEKDKAEKCQGNHGQRNNSAKYFSPFLPRMLSGFPCQILLTMIDFDKLHCKGTAWQAAPKTRPEGNCCAQRR